MGWSGGIASGSTVGATATFSSDTSTKKQYTLGNFKAAKHGMYKFQLYGSAGEPAKDWWFEGAHHNRAAAGQGGYTEYYMELTEGQTIYLGVGGPNACAYISKTQSSTTSSSLTGVAQGNVYCVAGAGGSGGEWGDSNNGTGYNCKHSPGGAGGGTNGASSTLAGDCPPGTGGSQTSGGQVGEYQNPGGYGYGGNTPGSGDSGYTSNGGTGGDGWYGGGSGRATTAEWKGASASGGGGGSSYANNGLSATIVYNGTTYTNRTVTGGGSTGNGYIVITFIQNPNGVPQPPTLRLNKTVADVLGEECYLSWSNGSAGYCNKIIKYTIYRDGTKLGDVNTEAASYENYKVVAPTNTNSSYSYTVTTTAQSTLGDGKTFTSAQSSPITLATTERTAPSAPTDVMTNNAVKCYIGDQGLTELTITWTPSISGMYNIVKEYQIYKDDVYLTSSTTNSCSILDQENHLGTYKVRAIGETGAASPFSDTTTVILIDKPTAVEMQLFVSEVCAYDIPLRWNTITAPTGTTISYLLQYKIKDEEAVTEADITEVEYTFPIERVVRGTKFDLYTYAKANASGNSYRLSDVNIIETGRVSEFNIPRTEETFWKGIYDPASLLTGRQAHAYESISLNWAHATPTETSGKIFTYTLKCRIGSSAWNDIYTISKAPGDSDYSDDLHYSYSLANTSANTRISFYVLTKDNYDTQIASPEFTVTKMAAPIISNVSSTITYRKAIVGLTGTPTTNGLTDKLQYTIYFSYNEKEAQYGTGTIENDSGIVPSQTYEFKLENGKNANINTFLGALYEKVITNKYPYPDGKFRIKVNYKSYPNCYTTATTNITYNFLNEIQSAPKITLTMPTAHTAYANSGDIIRYSFAPIGWTDAAGGTSGADIVYTISSNYQISLTNPQSPNTTYTTTMPAFVQDGIVIYTLNTKISYADGNSRSNTTAVSFNAARWCDTDALSINNIKRKSGTVSGNYVLPPELWRSSKYDNLSKIVLTIYGQDKETLYEDSKKTVTTFTNLNLKVPFSFSGVDDSTDLTICAKALCTNTSGDIITIFSVFYLIRSAAITMALRKGALGINVADDFAPTQTDSTLFVNAKADGTAPTVVINESDDQANNGEALRITKGITDCGGLSSYNGVLFGRKMGTIIKTVLPVATSLAQSNYIITNKNFIKTQHISMDIDLNLVTAQLRKTIRHLRIDDVVHNTTAGTVTIEYHVTKAPKTVTNIPIIFSVVNIISD